jgi:Methylmalonic aciduria and homocystinuria type D protein
MMLRLVRVTGKNLQSCSKVTQQLLTAARSSENGAAGLTSSIQQRGLCSKSSDQIPEVEEQQKYFISPRAEREINLFGPKDRRLQLPGNVGFAQALEKDGNKEEMNALLDNVIDKSSQAWSQVLHEESNLERHDRVFDQVVEQVESEQKEALAELMAKEPSSQVE